MRAAVTATLAAAALWWAADRWVAARRLADADLSRLGAVRAATVRQAQKFIDKLEQTPRAEWSELQWQYYGAARKALEE